MTIALLTAGGLCGDNDRQLVVFLKGDGHIQLNDDVYSDNEHFAVRLERLFLIRHDRSVFVMANPDVEFRQLIGVLDAVERNGAKAILLSHVVAKDPANCGPVGASLPWSNGRSSVP